MHLKDESGGGQLCYCTNIHPGESVEELIVALRETTARVKSVVCPAASMGIGLRISDAASRQLQEPELLARLGDTLSELGLHVFTINGFPYGRFHGAPVKEQVYEPDWSHPERLAYTHRLARVLSPLLPEGGRGSISTVPGCFKPKDSPNQRNLMVQALLEQAAVLWQIHQTTGREICLALEPEPECLLEISADAVRLFEQLLATPALIRFGQLTGLNQAAAEAALRRHLGVCVDACHAAVEFEEPAQCISQLQAAGIKIAKLQISCGLVVPDFTELSRERLTEFVDATYLHQTVVQEGSERRHYLDLPLALQTEQKKGTEWRVHYHVPIFGASWGVLNSTQSELKEFLRIQRDSPFTEHLEVETYTWDVLPENYRTTLLHEAIARELDWVLKELGSSPC